MIYFAQLPTGAIKIGHSENVAERTRSLGSHYGCDVDILHTMEGDRQVERSLHERFAHLRFGRTEQFRPGPDLAEFIGLPLLVAANPDAAVAQEINPDINTKPPTRLDPAVVTMGRAVAGARGITMTEYLSGILRGPVSKDYAAMLRELEKGGGE